MPFIPRSQLPHVRCLIVALIALLLGVRSSIAIDWAPPPDTTLVKSPLIVVGKLSAAPLVKRSRGKDRKTRVYETRAEIIIDRVIRGDIEPGKQTILLQSYVGWDEGVDWVADKTSTRFHRGANPAHQCIWFLRRKRGLDAKDKKEYPFLNSFYDVQPLEHEPYFQAMLGKAWNTEIPKLLRSDSDAVVLRTLKWIAGEELPWPYGPPEYQLYYHEDGHKPLVKRAQDVWDVTKKHKSVLVRRVAASVYAHLLGDKAVAKLRELMQDADGDIRGIAIGCLAAHADVKSAEQMAKAATGVNDGEIACGIIDRLPHLKKVDAIVPIMLTFLQNDDFIYQSGHDLGIPAFKARAALQKLTGDNPFAREKEAQDPFSEEERRKPDVRAPTGHLFPFDVAASQRAWAKAKLAQNPRQRRAMLAELLPQEKFVWKATFVAKENKTQITVTNTSKQWRTLPKWPYDVSFGNGGTGFLDTWIRGKQDFVTLSPGASHRFELRKAIRAEKVELLYTRNGNEFGVNAWLGFIPAIPAAPVKKMQ